MGLLNDIMEGTVANMYEAVQNRNETAFEKNYIILVQTVTNQAIKKEMKEGTAKLLADYQKKMEDELKKAHDTLDEEEIKNKHIRNLLIDRIGLATSICFKQNYISNEFMQRVREKFVNDMYQAVYSGDALGFNESVELAATTIIEDHVKQEMKLNINTITEKTLEDKNMKHGQYHDELERYVGEQVLVFRDLASKLEYIVGLFERQNLITPSST